MKLLIKGKNIDVTEALKEYVEKKIGGKIEKHDKKLSKTLLKAEIELSISKNPRIQDNQTVSVTIHADGGIIRAQESSEDMYASIDLVSDKIERQLKRFKQKRSDNTKKIKTSLALTEETRINENEFPKVKEYDEFPYKEY